MYYEYTDLVVRYSGRLGLSKNLQSHRKTYFNPSMKHHNNHRRKIVTI